MPNETKPGARRGPMQRVGRGRAGSGLFKGEGGE